MITLASEVMRSSSHKLFKSVLQVLWGRSSFILTWNPSFSLLFNVGAWSLRHGVYGASRRLKAHWVAFDLGSFSCQRARQLTRTILKNFFMCILKNVLGTSVIKLWLTFDPLIPERFIYWHVLKLGVNLPKWSHKITSVMTLMQSFSTWGIFTILVCSQSLLQSVGQIDVIFGWSRFYDNRWTFVIFDLLKVLLFRFDLKVENLCWSHLLSIDGGIVIVDEVETGAPPFFILILALKIKGL